MPKEDFFAKHQSAGHRVAVSPIDGLPKLFMRKLSHGEYSLCLAKRETFEGKKGYALDYAICCVVACVDEGGKPYFTKDDLGSLQLLGQDGILPFAEAFNEANGMNEGPKDPGPAESDAAA